MTITDVSNVTTTTGNASTTAFSTGFIFFASSDLVVTLDAITKVLDTDYTVTGGSGAVGTVTFTTAPASSVAIIIERVVAYEQQTDFANFDGNPSDVTEDQFDLGVMQSQQLRDLTNRSIFVPVGTSGFDGELTLTSNGLKFLQLKTDLSGFQFTTALDTSQSAISTYGETLIDDANAAEARQTLLLPAQSASKRGSILVQNGTDDGYEQITSQGTAAQALISNGADALPSFQSLATVLLVTKTASTSATINFNGNIDSTYKNYLARWTDVVPSADGTIFWVRVSIASSFKSGASDYQWVADGVRSNAPTTIVATGDATAAQIEVTSNNGIGSSTGESGSGELILPNPSGTALHKSIRFSSSQQASDAALTTQLGSGTYVTGVEAIDDIQFLFATSNIASGTFELFGIL